MDLYTMIWFLNGFDHSLNLKKTRPNPTPTQPQPDRRQTFSQLKHIQSSSNFQDIFQHDLQCQRLPHPSSLQSGTFNILQAPNLYFLSQIMSDLDETFRICPLATTNLICDVKVDHILQVSSQEPSTSSKSTTYAFSAKSCLILIKLSG